MEGPHTLMEPRECHTYILTGFLIWAFIHHVASRWIFRNNPAYCALSGNKRMEWDSRSASIYQIITISITFFLSISASQSLHCVSFSFVPFRYLLIFLPDLSTA